MSDLDRNRFVRGLSDAAWCRWALEHTYWPDYQDITVVLETPQAFDAARSIVEDAVKSGWTYDGTDGDGEVILCFSRQVPVSSEDKEKARKWLEKYTNV